MRSETRSHPHRKKPQWCCHRAVRCRPTATFAGVPAAISRDVRRCGDAAACQGAVVCGLQGDTGSTSEARRPGILWATS